MAKQLKDVHGIALKNVVPCKSNEYNNILIVKDVDGSKYVVHRGDIHPNFKRKPSTSSYGGQGFNLRQAQSIKNPERYISLNR